MAAARILQRAPEEPHAVSSNASVGARPASEYDLPHSIYWSRADDTVACTTVFAFRSTYGGLLTADREEVAPSRRRRR